MLITYSVVASFIDVEKEKIKPVYFYYNLGQSVKVTKLEKKKKYWIIFNFYVTMLSIFPNFSSLER